MDQEYQTTVERSPRPTTGRQETDTGFSRAIRSLQGTGLAQRTAPPVDILSAPFDELPTQIEAQSRWNWRRFRLARRRNSKLQPAKLALNKWRESTRDALRPLTIGPRFDANSIAWMAHLASLEGDRLESNRQTNWAGQIYRDMLESARHLRHKAGLKQTTFALALECHFLNEICEWSNAKTINSESISEMRQWLDEFVQHRDGLAEALLEEASNLREAEPDQLLPYRWLAQQFRDVTVRATSCFTRHPEEDLIQLAISADEIESLCGLDEVAWRKVEALPFMQELLQRVQTLAEYDRQRLALHSVTRTVLMAAEFYRKTGYFPSDITTAAREFGAPLPRDPFSPSEEAIRYRLARGQKLSGIIGPKNQRRLRTRVGQPLVYSVAANGVDDHCGEAWSRGEQDGDWVFPLRRDRTRRNWLQFDLRMLLPLMAVVAIYLAVTQTGPKRRERAIEAINQYGSAEINSQTMAQGLFGGEVITKSVQSASLTDPPTWVLQRLADVPEIEVLDIDGEVSRAGLKAISRLTNLKQLDLDDTTTTPAGVAYLANLTNLEELTLSSIPVSDEQLRPLHRCTKLTSLYCNSTRVTGVAFDAFAGAPALTNLTLLGSPVTSAGMVQIGTLTSLEHLDLDSTPISGDDLSHLAKLTNLTSLDLRNNNYGARGIKLLPTLPKLTSLYLLSVQLTKSDFERLPDACPVLTELDLDGCGMDDSMLKPIAKIKTLIDLDITNNPQIIGSGLHYVHSLPNLSTLDTDVEKASMPNLLWKMFTNQLSKVLQGESESQ